MPEKSKLKRVLVPYSGMGLPVNALTKAIESLDEKGELFLLHVIDEAPVVDLSYQTGQSEYSELIKIFRETQRKVQKNYAREVSKEIKKEGSKHKITVTPLYAIGDPAEEVLKIVSEYSIQLVVIEKLRDRIVEIFHGDEINYLCERAPCEVLRVPGRKKD